MKAALLILVVMLSGCSAVEIATGFVVDDYCSQPEAARLAVRQLINAGAAPHYVYVSCEVDNNFFIKPPRNTPTIMPKAALAPSLTFGGRWIAGGR
jgi:hypothetical protein